jgi:hypothetical protein
MAHLPTAVSLLLLEALFMQISGVSLALTWPCRLCLLSVLLGATITVTRFPLSKHTGGGDSAPAFSGQCVYLLFMWEVGLPPISCGVFLPLPLLQAFLLLVAGHVPPLLPSPNGLFIYSSVRGCPSPPLQCWGHHALFAASFLCYCLLFSFFFLFSLGGGRSVQGSMLIWPWVVCGRTTYSLAYLVDCVFPSGLGAGVWWCRSPPGFSAYCGVGMLCTGWGCGGVKVLPLLGGFSCKVYLQRLSKILL